MADTGQLFLSYSRQELYFAEMLVTRLEDAGLSIWFDLQRLRPGESWEKGINSGLGNMQGVVFVASKASLKSSYATQEWQAAIDRKLPIYVIIFEELLDKNGDSNSQERLQHLISYEHSHIIDFRTKFEQQAKRLIAVIKKEANHENDSIPEVMRYGWRKLPFHVRNVVFLNLAGILTIVGVLILVTLSGLVMTIYPIEDSTYSVLWLFLTMVAGLIGLIAVFAYELRKILRRDYHPSLIMLFNLFITLITFLVFAFIPVLQFLAPIFGTMQFLYIIQAINFSNDWLRYAPRGIGSQRRRIKANKYKLPKLKEIQPATYRLDYVQADEQVARKITRYLHGVKHERDDENYDYNLIIISNRASKELFARASKNDERTIGVVVSCVNNAGLDKRLMAEQLFDFRQHDKRTLQAVAQYLATPDDNLVTYSHLLVPRDFQEPLTPRTIYYYVNFIRLLCIGSILFFGLIVSAVFTSLADNSLLERFEGDVTHAHIFGIATGIISLLIYFVVGYYILINRLIVRHHTVRRFITLLTGFHVSVVFLLISLVGISTDGVEYFDILFIIMILIISCMIGVIATAITLIPMYRPINNWLPHTVDDKHAVETLEVKSYPIVTPAMRYHLSLLFGVLAFIFLLFISTIE